MKRNKIFSACCVVLTVLTILTQTGGVFAQTYHVGDLYEFPDGTKGVVCYVNPENGKKGWVVALNDLDQKYALCISGPSPSGYTDRDGFGKESTRLLLESGKSPAAEAVDREYGVYNGWYIPDIAKLQKIYVLMPLLKSRIEHYGGSITKFGNGGYTSAYWSSTYLSWGNSYRSLSTTGIEYYFNDNGIPRCDGTVERCPPAWR